MLIVNLAVAWYNVAMIWLMQLDVFPSWAYVDTSLFGELQGQHFYRLFITVFPQAIMATVLSGELLRRAPVGSTPGLLWTGLGLQAATWILTAVLWGRWQGQIALPTGGPMPKLGPANTALYELLVRTHWLRVALITAYAVLASVLVYRAFKHGEMSQEQ